MSNLTQLETTLHDSNWDIIKHSSKLHDQLREYDNAGGQIAKVEMIITGIYLFIRSLMKISNLLFTRNVISSPLKGRPMQMQPSTMY